MWCSLLWFSLSFCAFFYFFICHSIQCKSMNSASFFFLCLAQWNMKNALFVCKVTFLLGDALLKIGSSQFIQRNNTNHYIQLVLYLWICSRDHFKVLSIVYLRWSSLCLWEKLVNSIFRIYDLGLACQNTDADIECTLNSVDSVMQMNDGAFVSRFIYIKIQQIWVEFILTVMKHMSV